MQACRLPSRHVMDSKERLADLCGGRTLVLLREKQLNEHRTDQDSVIDKQDGRHGAAALDHAGHFIVVREPGSGLVADIERYDRRAAIVFHAGGDGVGGKDARQQRNEYEDGQPSHVSTIL